MSAGCGGFRGRCEGCRGTGDGEDGGMTVHKLYKPRGPARWTREGGWEPVRPGSWDHPIQQAHRNQMLMEKTRRRTESQQDDSDESEEQAE